MVKVSWANMTEFFGAWSGNNDNDGEIESVETVETVTTTTTTRTRKKVVEPEEVSQFCELRLCRIIGYALDRDWCRCIFAPNVYLALRSGFRR